MHWVTQVEGGPKRVNHAAVAMGDKIYTFGGYCNGENMRDYQSIDVHVLNTKTFRWTKHPVSDLPFFENDDILPFKRYGHTAVHYEDKIYIWGGRNDRGACSALFCFDTVWHCWRASPCTGDIPFGRDGHTACLCGSKMYIFGGYEDETESFAKGVFMLDLEKMHWSYVHTSGSEPLLRDFHTAVCIDNKMYLFGGRSSEILLNVYLPREKYCSNLWYLDLTTRTWHKPITYGQKPQGRRSHSAFVYNEKMYIFGGYNATEGQHYNDMFEFNPRNNQWKRLKPYGDGPCRRRRHASVLVNNRVFFIGGTSPVMLNGEQVSTTTEGLIDHSDMYVLDLFPTLKTLCLLVTKKFNLDDSILPSNIRSEYHNMCTPNKITTSRPNNSAG